MLRSKKTVMLVPPGGRRIRYVRIRLAFLVTVMILLIAGFAGYFIPFNNFAPDVVELNQKRNLEQQNRKLLERILDMLRNLTEVRSKLAGLTEKRKRVDNLTGKMEPDTHQTNHKAQLNIASMGADELFDFIDGIEKRAEYLTAHLEKYPDCFSALPILLPVPEKPVVAAEYGRIRDPFTNAVKLHSGVDFIGRRGLPVLVTATGVVDELGTDKRWGKYAVIRHSRTVSTFYAHLDNVTVGRGKRVNRGDVLGTLGSTGLCSGPHLHYEIRVNGRPVDPRAYWYPVLAQHVVSSMRTMPKDL